MTDSLNVPAQPQLHGIGGWLILPMLGTLVSPLINLKGVLDSLVAIGSPEFSTYLLSLKIFTIAELVITVGIICAWIYAAILLFRHKRLYPALFSYLLLFTLVYGLAEIAIVLAYFRVEPDPSAVKDVVRAFISCCIWAPYMVKSQRVANTFVK